MDSMSLWQDRNLKGLIHIGPSPEDDDNVVTYTLCSDTGPVISLLWLTHVKEKDAVPTCLQCIAKSPVAKTTLMTMATSEEIVAAFEAAMRTKK